MMNTCNCLICNKEIEDSGGSSGIYNEGTICYECQSQWRLSGEYKDLAEISLEMFVLLDRDNGLIEYVDMEKYQKVYDEFKDILENTCEWWGISLNKVV